VFQPGSGSPDSIRAERGQSATLVLRGQRQPSTTLELAVALRERDLAIVRIARMLRVARRMRSVSLCRTISYEPTLYADTPSDIAG
jgi:hypothetical protein